MSIQKDRIAAFYDAVRALTYTEMLEVAEEIANYTPDNERITTDICSRALVDAAAGKPANHVTTRGEA